MSKVFIEESTLTAIGDAIRGKTGGTDLIAPLDMPTEINGISTGGGTLPSEALILKGIAVIDLNVTVGIGSLTTMAAK